MRCCRCAVVITININIVNDMVADILDGRCEMCVFVLRSAYICPGEK